MLLSLFVVKVLLLIRQVQGLDARGAPNEPKGVKVTKTPNGSRVRYKENAICETTPGVRSYSGYIDVNPDVHIFFWFFESRNDPANDPVTLWQNGGPGTDSLFGLFGEVGPCSVSDDKGVQLRQWSWNKNSNLLFLSEPSGSGFSYGSTKEGYLDSFVSVLKEKTDDTGEYGRFAQIDPTRDDNSRLAAVTAWEVLQAFYSVLPTLSNNQVRSTDFIFWAESYGGHLGPAFAKHFYEQNQKLEEQKLTGRKLNFKSFGLVNAMIDAQIQEKFSLEYTRPDINPYGLKLIDDTVYDHGHFNMYRDYGCQSQIDECVYYQQTDAPDSWLRYQCAKAQFVCQISVDSLYYITNTKQGLYDIRNCRDRDEPPWLPWAQYLNTSHVQDALGVDLNYTSSSFSDYLIYNAFSLSGDFAYSYLPAIEELLKYDIQIAFMYGDADWIASWPGGEAVSLNASWTGHDQFNKAGYSKLVVDGKEYGDVRQYGKFSFTRVWEAGHEVPFFQPEAAFAVYNRSAMGVDIATGKVDTKGKQNKYATQGPKHSTYRRVIETPRKC